MSKTLKIKRSFAWALYNNLKNTPPKEYPTTGEIKTTITDILPALKAQVGKYMEIMKDFEALVDEGRNLAEVDKEATDEKKAANQKMIQEKVDKVNDDFRVYNKSEGVELIDVDLSDEAFKTLKQQFEREKWGKNWISSIEDFSELLDVFTDEKKEEGK